jgi:ABC-type multidrug transport system, ATPase and permease components
MILVFMLRVMIYAPIVGIGGVFKALNTNASMAWIIALALSLVLSMMIFLFVVVMPKFKIVQKLIDKINLVTREILTGIPVIRAFSNQKHEEKRFDKVNKDLKKNSLFVSRVMNLMMPTMMFIMNSICILIVWKGAHGIEEGIMQIGDMMAYIQYTMQIVMSFLMIGMLSIMLPRSSVSATRINEILEIEPSIKNPKNPKNFSSRIKGTVEFKNVSFRYADSDEDVLTDITFKANKGETVAFIGSTGSGKSTLINLIPRLFDVTKGEILVNNINVKDVNEKDLHKKIGFVPQKGILFTGTIESNIKYGAKEATIKEIKKAASIAQATDFINSKKKKYKEEIAQGGTNVSGGQKQRLSIARAIATNPEIYIFDDSFSALDFKTDSTLRKALFTEMKEATILIVAQRVSTIMNADKIIVLDEGKIVGIGKHKELLKDCSVYNEIASSQLTKEELDNE